MAAQLVRLPEIERLSQICIRILGGNPGKFTLQGTNTYLIGSGRSRLLIDTGDGTPSWIAALKNILSQEQATVDSALITHWHPDHVGGISQLKELLPTTKVYKNNPSAGQLDIQDGQKFTVDGATLVAVHSPGHTTDHMSFILEEEDAMFTGDNVLGHGTAVFEDLQTYMQSLETMAHMFRGRAYPGHGAVITDGPAKLAEYREHRRQRETQVIDALQADKTGSGLGSMDLVQIIYSDVRKDLHEAAERGVVQILNKLQREGRTVRLASGAWSLTYQPSL